MEQSQREEGGSSQNPYEEARQREDELRRVRFRFQESRLFRMMCELREVAQQNP